MAVSSHEADKIRLLTIFWNRDIKHMYEHHVPMKMVRRKRRRIKRGRGRKRGRELD
jgi:hypothetical protein